MAAGAEWKPLVLLPAHANSELSDLHECWPRPYQLVHVCLSLSRSHSLPLSFSFLRFWVCLRMQKGLSFVSFNIVTSICICSCAPALHFGSSCRWRAPDTRGLKRHPFSLSTQCKRNCDKWPQTTPVSNGGSFGGGLGLSAFFTRPFLFPFVVFCAIMPAGTQQ